MRRYVYRFWPLDPLLVFSVQPAGIALIDDAVFQPMSTNIRSFCWTPAGVSTTTVVLATTLFVDDDRSVMGVVFLTVAVTVQLGVVDGFSVSWCVAAMS